MSFVRVRLPNDHEATLGADYVAGIEGLEILDQPATNLRGRPLPASRKDGRPIKPRVTVDEAAAKKAATAWLLQRAAAARNTTTNGGDAEGGTTA